MATNSIDVTKATILSFEEFLRKKLNGEFLVTERKISDKEGVLVRTEKVSGGIFSSILRVEYYTHKIYAKLEINSSSRLNVLITSEKFYVDILKPILEEWVSIEKWSDEEHRQLQVVLVDPEELGTSGEYPVQICR